jgi:hypothetical protein
VIEIIQAIGTFNCGTRTTPLAAVIEINRCGEEISQLSLSRIRLSATEIEQLGLEPAE